MAEGGVVALAGMTLVASLFGSAHCAGMCGGVALVASGDERGTRLSRAAGYHAGRLASYLLVGAVAGMAGAVVDDAGALVGLQRVAAIAAGLTIAAFGVMTVLRGFGLPIGVSVTPAVLVRLAQRVHATALRLPAPWRGLPLGLATPLLPCGWLYAFVAIAAAGGSAVVGMVVMAAFWAGTVPALAAVAGGARIVLARLGRAAPIAMGIAMCAVGAHVAVTRATIAGDVLRQAAQASLRTQEVARANRSAGDGAPASLAGAVAEVASEVPPCCRRTP